MGKEIRTRIAPSPTGDPHVGTLHTALYNYAFAKSHGGKFILRIEDTDRVRSKKEYEKAIFDAFRWAGIEWDEGPDRGGPFAPYRQSERFDIYKKYAQELIDKGHAYRCFCTPDRLQKLREELQKKNLRTKYDSFCSGLSEEEVKNKIKNKIPYTIRMKVPKDGICRFDDLLRGEIPIDYETVDEQILIKSDGYPTYHLANVVDDHLMGITHVIRGEEWINSAPKHLLLYSYFGWEPPVLCHMPLLRNPDKSKLSKRKNPTSINYYRRLGILPEALLNFLGQMGWTMPDGREKFSIDEMVKNFDIKRVTPGGPVFDILKLKALNAKYIRESMSPDELWERLKGWLFNDETFRKIMPLVQKRLTSFSDFIEMVEYLFSGKISINSFDIAIEGKSEIELKEIFQICVWEIEKITDWNKDNIYSCFKRASELLDIKLKHLMAPFYFALSGKKDSLPVFDSMEILGRDMCRMRILDAINSFREPGIKGKALKRLQKRYEELFGVRN